PLDTSTLSLHDALPISVRESMTRLLRMEHYEVLPARDGVEAIERFRSHIIDLVVLDLNLGSESGWQVFQRMTELNPYVPTIIVTDRKSTRLNSSHVKIS